LRFNQPDCQNRNYYNPNKNHNWNQGRQYNPQYNSHNQWNSNKDQQNKPQQVWDLNILNTPSLKYPTKLTVLDLNILVTASLMYLTKILVWELKILSAVVELSDTNQINNMSESIPNQKMDLENEITNIINKEHSKINVQVTFRTDIRGEINTENDRAIYSKQYPYALSASDFVNSEKKEL